MYKHLKCCFWLNPYVCDTLLSWLPISPMLVLNQSEHFLDFLPPSPHCHARSRSIWALLPKFLFHPPIIKTVGRDNLKLSTSITRVNVANYIPPPHTNYTPPHTSDSREELLAVIRSFGNCLTRGLSSSFHSGMVLYCSEPAVVLYSSFALCSFAF